MVCGMTSWLEILNNVAYVVYKYNKTSVQIVGAFKDKLDAEICVENNREAWTRVDYARCKLK